MKKYDRLIFVSRSDTIHGPMAAAMLQNRYLLDTLDIASKGLVVLFPEPANPKAQAVMKKNGLPIEGHRSDLLAQEDFDDRTLMLVMTEEDRQKIFESYTLAQGSLVRVFHEFLGMAKPPQSPYGGSLEDYETFYKELEAMISRLVIHLNEEELLC